MIKYIVGIDFGNEKTAAWAVPVSDYNDASLPLSGISLLLKTFNFAEHHELRSVVFHTSDSEYSLDFPGCECSCISHMKKPVAEMSDMDKHHYAIYIHKVIERLIDLNKGILRIENGEPNFRLYLASPSSWSNEDKLEHLIFFNSSIKSLGLQFDAAIDETYGAFFSFHEDESDMQKCSLVINYGSSTIDYTAIKNGKIISDKSWSNQQLGASLIEKHMLMSIKPKKSEGYNDYTEMIHATQQMLTSYNLTHIDPEQVLLFELCRLKEEKYNQLTDTYKLNFDFEQVTANPDFDSLTYVAKGNLPDVTRDYQDAVRDDLIKLRNRLSEKLKSLNSISSSGSLNITKEYRPDRIILSGGACIMRWFTLMVRDVFNIQEIVLSKYPKFDVAKGVALYARQSYLNNTL